MRRRSMTKSMTKLGARAACWLLCVGAPWGAGLASAQPLDAGPAKQKATAKREAAAKEKGKEKEKQSVARNGNYNVATPTAGGIHYWGDELCYFDWRIQRHALTGHCRLIDGANINTRHAWGSFEECERELERIRERDELPAMSGRAVIVLHGLGGFTAVMAPLADRLREGEDCQVFNLAYPSMHGDMASHARGLASVIEHLDGIERIDLVGHSMGNVVLRYYLGEAERSSEGHDPRLERVVMLAPPNRQSERAAWWGEIRLVSDLLGKSFRQLGADWPEIADKLGVPPGEFGIIAGGKKNDRGFAFFLEGDDDGVLSVESTRLEGATDFVVLPVRHEVMLIDKETHDCAARFLATGRFAAPEVAARDEPLVEEPKDEAIRE